MSLITFVPHPSYPGLHGIINAGGGVSYDVGQALSTGGGQIVIDSVQQPILASALRAYPGLIVQGTVPGSLSKLDVLSMAMVHSLRADKSDPQTGDVLVRGDDNTYYPAINTGGTGTGPGAPPTNKLTLTTVATDTFDRANGTVVNANWLAITSGGMAVSANEALGTAGTALGNYRTGETYTDDHYSKCEVGSVALVSGGYIGPSVRNRDAQNNMTLIYFNNAGTFLLSLYKKIAGTYNLLFSKALGGVLAQGSVIELIAEGNVFTALIGGVPQFAIIDNTFTISGSPGIESIGANTLNNWEGGNAHTGAVGAALATDNFTRANGNVSVGAAGWTLMNYPSGQATVEIPIVSNQLSVQNPPILAHAGDVRTDAYNADQWSELLMGTTALNTSGFVGATTRNQGAGATLGNSGYLGVMFQNAGYQIYRLDNGVSTLLLALQTLGNDPAGTRYMLVSQGSRHSLRINGAEVGAVIDATYSVGPPGIMMYPNSTADSWSGGNV